MVERQRARPVTGRVFHDRHGRRRRIALAASAAVAAVALAWLALLGYVIAPVL
jgi:hypothetical protein